MDVVGVGSDLEGVHAEDAASGEDGGDHSRRRRRVHGDGTRRGDVVFAQAIRIREDRHRDRSETDSRVHVRTKSDVRVLAARAADRAEIRGGLDREDVFVRADYFLGEILHAHPVRDGAQHGRGQTDRG